MIFVFIHSSLGSNLQKCLESTIRFNRGFKYKSFPKDRGSDLFDDRAKYSEFEIFPLSYELSDLQYHQKTVPKRWQSSRWSQWIQCWVLVSHSDTSHWSALAVQSPALPCTFCKRSNKLIGVVQILKTEIHVNNHCMSVNNS